MKAAPKPKTAKAEKAAKAPLSPRSLLLPYQRDWADDEARFKVGLMARQVGKDFSSGEEGIRDCYQHELRGEKTMWMIAAPSERQSMESLEKWKEWALAYKLAIESVVYQRESSHPEALLTSGTITFPKGSRVLAVPGKPDTVRGFSANLLFTEFAFFEDPDRTWRAALPSITNPLRGGLKKVRIISTPNGQGNKFHELWTKNYLVPGAKWSAHKVTIYDAVSAGLPIDIEELRAALDDPDGWAQEYLCEFIDSSSVLLPYELLVLVESPTATETIGPEFWTSTTPYPVVLGIDFGRKRDLTVCWADEVINNYSLCKEVLALRKVSTPDQIEVLRPRIRKANRVCFDYTGPGIGMGDYLVREFGEWKPDADLFGKIELCNFTSSFKQDVFSKLKMSVERRGRGIPISRVVREDLHSVYRVTTKSGTVTYSAPHTEDGHADICTALALANRAASALGGGIGTAADVIMARGGFVRRQLRMAA